MMLRIEFYYWSIMLVLRKKSIVLMGQVSEKFIKIDNVIFIKSSFRTIIFYKKKFKKFKPNLILFCLIDVRQKKRG